MKEKLVLINPPSKQLGDDKVSIPLGILYIASYVREIVRYPVELIDFTGQTSPEIPVNCRYYGFTSVTPQWSFVKRQIAEIKKTTPNAIFVVGGPHPTALPEKCLEDGASLVVVGEGEETIAQILTGVSWNEIDGLVYSGCSFRPRSRMIDLDLLPFPARDLVQGYKKHTIMCSRGCPFSCKFCGSASIWGRKIVLRSVTNIEAEVDFLIQNFGITHLGVRDEIFGMNKDWTNQFCDMIAKKNITWEVQTRPMVCKDLKFLEKIATSGCKFVSLGIESGSPDILRSIPKEMPEKNLHAIENISKFGLLCRGFFIIGLPGETDESIEETAQFILKARKIGLTNISLFTFVPFPGNEFYRKFYDNVKIGNYDDYYHVTKDGKGAKISLCHDRDKLDRWNARLADVSGNANDVFRYQYEKQ